MKALNAAEMREVDRLTTERFGVPSLKLMEAAGKHVAEAVLRAFVPDLPKKIAVLCGKGNNGGDGFVAARYLQKNVTRLCAYLFAAPEELRGDAAINFKRWQESGGQVTLIQEDAAWGAAWPEIANTDVIVDALLGTGLRGAATGQIAQAITDLNGLSRNAAAPRPALILAVDTPSGLPSDGERADGPLLRVHETLTFTAPKIGQLISPDAAAVGLLEVRGIGSPAALIEEVGKGTLRWAEPEEFAGLPLVRAADSHKGSFGHVLLVAGSVGKSGAAVLAGRAALIAGSGLVTVAVPDGVLPAVTAGQAEYMTAPLRSTNAGTAALRNLEGQYFTEIASGKTVLAVGPGVGTQAETQEFIRTIVLQTELPVVLDADGLNAFAGKADSMRERKTKFLCVTPHPGEMARLLGLSSAKIQADRVQAAVEAARRWNAHVVLKGFHTIVAGPNGAVFVNTTGNAGLAKGGSGDVLTGILAALTAQFGTDEWLRVLALGVYLHGSAAEAATEKTDVSGLLAGVVAEAIPQARQRLVRELQRRG